MTAPAADPTWFGPDHRLFGWVHRPAPGAAVRAAVVLCPAMGQEESFTHYAMREVAEQLAERGFVAVRFDWDSTGDSLGDPEEPGRLAAWDASLAEAVGLARAHADAPVVLLGMRLGALLAVHAATGLEADGLVLWDAPRSGSAFIREQRVRQHVALGDADPDDGAFSGLGLALSEETLAALAALTIRGLDVVPARRVLDVTRGTRATVDAPTRDGHDVDRLVATDQDEMLLRNVLPHETERGIVDWLVEQYDATGSLLTGPPAVLETRVPGGVERIVALGPHRLFGIRFVPDRPTTSATVVFVPEFHTPHTGLGRIWVRLGRSWGHRGIGSLRFDLSGCGDSPVLPGTPGHQCLLVDHIDEVGQVAEQVSPADPADVLLVGLCSGGYLSLESALDLRPRGVAVINPVLGFITPERPRSKRRRLTRVVRPFWDRLLGRWATRVALRQVRTGRVQTPTLEPNFAWDRAFEVGYWEDWIIREGWLRRVPDRLWRVFNRLVLTQQTDEILGRVTGSGVPALVIFGEPDWTKLSRGSRRELDALDGLSLVYEPRLDHAMMRPGMTDRVSADLTSFVGTLLDPVRGRSSPRKTRREGEVRPSEGLREGTPRPS